ncbi:hypothetical protein [Enterovirga sp.]|uniref:hypothetical protein n=1 Tax=Enterovirga sp. TaxID=2026350 RepID=UPI002625DF0E|nr:hypothetical protein [Enterovirga sp.]MDB5592395.1 hypothetical protein [Enterovirga sp.]
MSSRVTRAEILACLAAAGLVAALLGVTSGYTPWLSPDTGGYVAAATSPEPWGQARHPLFGWILGWLGGPHTRGLPLVQVALYLTGGLALLGALRSYGLSVRAAASLGLSLLGSNLVLLWHNAVHPELLSASLMLLALALAVRLAAGAALATAGVALAAALGLAYLLRPTFLPGIVLLPLLYGLLARLHGPGPVLSRALLLLVLCATPFLANAAWRQAKVGDFNIVSFGGFQMSGMAGLMLSPEVVGRLPSDLRPLGQAILDGRTAAEARGDVIATPLNSRGERSFVSAALGYYDLYARTYDSLLYGVIAPLQGDESWVAWNSRLMRFSVATVRAAPDRYAAWLVGGTARAVGRMVATNVPLVLALALLAPLFAAAAWRRRLPLRPGSAALDVPALLCLTVVYTAAAGALMVVTTFPAARYLDTAGLLLPALPIYAALSLVAGLTRRG